MKFVITIIRFHIPQYVQIYHNQLNFLIYGNTSGSLTSAWIIRTHYLVSNNFKGIDNDHEFHLNNTGDQLNIALNHNIPNETFPINAKMINDKSLRMDINHHGGRPMPYAQVGFKF